VSKEKLRKKLIYLRKANFNDQSINFTQFKSILKKLNFKKNINIGGYYPINSEIGCLDILEKLEKNNFKISLPITKKNHDMDFYEWSFKDSLKVSYQGIPEPNIKKKVFPDVLIVPLIGFDMNKFRLGYGGGFYDRYISKISNLKKVFTVGFAFSFQEVKNIPINEHDQKLDFILTNKGIVK
jgi:5-formyltetrahydrofolate cyclo-ligase